MEKKLYLPKSWNEIKIDNNLINEKNNGLGMLTGKLNNIFVVDIDDTNDWNYLLEKTGNKEPDIVKAKSGSGGIHYIINNNS